MSDQHNHTRSADATGIAKSQYPSLIIGVVGIAAAVIGWFLNPAEFYKAWLPAYLFWFEIVAGALGILMLQYVTGGEWGLLIRRPLGAARLRLLPRERRHEPDRARARAVRLPPLPGRTVRRVRAAARRLTPVPAQKTSAASCLR